MKKSVEIDRIRDHETTRFKPGDLVELIGTGIIVLVTDDADPERDIFSGSVVRADIHANEHTNDYKAGHHSRSWYKPAFQNFYGTVKQIQTP